MWCMYNGWWWSFSSGQQQRGQPAELALTHADDVDGMMAWCEQAAEVRSTNQEGSGASSHDDAPSNMWAPAVSIRCVYTHGCMGFTLQCSSAQFQVRTCWCEMCRTYHASRYHCAALVCGTLAVSQGASKCMVGSSLAFFIVRQRAALVRLHMCRQSCDTKTRTVLPHAVELSVVKPPENKVQGRKQGMLQMQLADGCAPGHAVQRQ